MSYTHGIGPYSTGDTWPVHFYTSDIHPVHVINAVLGHIQPLIHSLYTFIHQTFTLYMSYTWYWAIFNIHPVIHTLCTFTSDIQTYTLYMSLITWYYCHIQPLIHSLYTFIHQTYTLYMSYTQYYTIFNRWYIDILVHFYTSDIHQTYCTCRIRSIGPYSTGDTWPVHFYTSDIHPVHVVYAVLGHIQPLIHSLYTFIHQTYTLYMSYT